MRDQYTAIGTIIAVVITSAGAALADTGWTPGVFAGAHIFSENNGLGVDDAPDADSLKNAPVLGARVLYGFTSLLGAEAELAFLSTSARQGGAAVYALGYRVHAMAEFGKSGARVRPFVLLGGAGMTALSTDIAQVDNATHFMFQGGAGAAFRIGDDWGVRVDARLFLPPSSDGPVALDFELSAGLYLSLGTTKDIMKAVGSISDRDGDGLVDNDDQCPDDPEDFDGFQDSDGCPEPDNDGDGIADIHDRCPNEAETVNNFDDHDGCPDTVPEAVAEFEGTIQGITFKLNSAEIKSSSFAVLDRAVKVLTEYPNLYIEIQGHTDNRGKDEYNLDLSQRRADAVKGYMVKKGVAEERLRARGYGMTQPVANNDTPEGQAENRRVEFRRIASEKAPEAAPADDQPAAD
jgi:outer membrane protein OmpA-like peptidoglycan-associated protein